MSSSEAPITDVRQDVKDGSRTARLGKPRKTQEEVAVDAIRRLLQ